MPAPRRGRLVAGEIVLDRQMLRVWRGPRQIRLRRSEFRLLEWLMSHAGYVYSRAELLRLVWPDHRGVSERAVDACVARLRRALNRPGERDPIRTVRFVGYAFDEQFASRGGVASMIPLGAE